jgi:hypothetical protein
VETVAGRQPDSMADFSFKRRAIKNIYFLKIFLIDLYTDLRILF